MYADAPCPSVLATRATSRPASAGAAAAKARAVEQFDQARGVDRTEGHQRRAEQEQPGGRGADAPRRDLRTLAIGIGHQRQQLQADHARDQQRGAQRERVGDLEEPGRRGVALQGQEQQFDLAGADRAQHDGDRHHPQVVAHAALQRDWQGRSRGRRRAEDARRALSRHQPEHGARHRVDGDEHLQRGAAREGDRDQQQVRDRADASDQRRAAEVLRALGDRDVEHVRRAQRDRGQQQREQAGVHARHQARAGAQVQQRHAGQDHAQHHPLQQAQAAGTSAGTSASWPPPRSSATNLIAAVVMPALATTTAVATIQTTRP